jgi:hypothetical protein
MGDGKTSIRGGFSVLFDTGNWSGYLNMVLDKLPYTIEYSSSFSEFPQYRHIDSLPLTFADETLAQDDGTTMEWLIQNPHMLTYNLTVDRELPYGVAMSVGYVGARGINLLANKAGNPRPQTVLADGRFFWAGNESRVNPAFGGATYYTSSANSFYNALQFTLRKQAGRGLQFQSSYTWSKLLDEGQAGSNPDRGGSSGFVATSYNMPRSLDWGRSDQTIAHSWRFNTIYRLPEFAGLQGVRGGLLNGWWMSGILTAQTGLPFTVSTGGTDRSRSLGAGNRPDVVDPTRSSESIVSGTTAGCGGVDPGQKLGGPELYFDPCAFALEPLGFLGTLGRNTLTAPGTANLDFSVVKDTPVAFLGESGSIQFRAEIFNLLNRANFSRPTSGVFSAPSPNVLRTAGRISSTNTKSRQVQLALKIVW